MAPDRSPGEMAVFVRVVELQSFSAAAQDLSLTPSGVSKIVGRLEERLGVRLLNRTTRKVALTTEGEAYFAECRQILARIDEAEAQLVRHREQPQGLLRMHCGLTFGEEALVPLIPEFLKRYPDIRLELILSDRIVDLMEEGGDLAIRIGGQPTPSLVARKICDLERIVCASPAYLRRHGEPRKPEDLRKHNCLYVSGSPQLRRWPFRTSRGPAAIEVTGNFSANNARSVLDLALKGVGIARLVDAVVEEPIRRGRLRRLFADSHQVEPVPLVALYLQSRRRLPKVTVMLDFLMEKFAHAPWRLPRKAARG
jgi:DNA-binding transcriptional LysR family regulator